MIFMGCMLLNKQLYSQDEIIMKEIVISGNKTEQRRSDISNQITVIKKETIENTPINNMGDLLEKKANVFVQRSQLGGSSPVIRGFEASRVLIVVDGVRMNNAIYRSGHLQNVITLDNYNLERAEVIAGPGSLIYGSDALGGVMHFITRKPILARDTNKFAVHADANLQYSTALQGKKLNFSIGLGGKKLGSFTSFTVADYGGLRIGNNNMSKYDDWGLNTKYIEFINGKDSIVANNNPIQIRNTQYSQYDVLQKFLYKPNAVSEYILNLQVSNSSNIPRTDRLNLLNAKGLPTNAEWDYGPQTRLFGSLQANYKKNTLLFSRLSLTAAFQKIHESRITRSYISPWRTTRFENVSVASLNADAVKFIGAKHGIYYGAEFLYNEVYSIAPMFNIYTAEQKVNTTRYPENGAYTRSYSVYVKDEYRISDMLTLSAGARFNQYSLNAGFAQPKNSVNFTDLSLNSSSVVGNIALNYHPCDDFKYYVQLSSGYRSPNLDDLGKFSPDAALNRVVVPNGNLNSEKIYNFEMGFYKRTSSKFEFEVIPYFMFLTDFFSIQAGQYNGQDSILADGQMMKVYALANKNNGINFGVSARMSYIFLNHVKAYTNYTYTYGRNLTDDVPLDHISPMFGIVGTEYSKGKLTIDVNMKYNGAKVLSQYGPVGSEDNIEYATADGTPAWWTLNANANYQITKAVKLNIGLDNLFDARYRPFSSTISAPGINAFIGLRAAF